MSSRTKSPQNLTSRILRSPYASISMCFLSWKLLLLGLALCTPAPAYDTSTSILLSRHPAYTSHKTPTFVATLSDRLTRWDAIYFTQAIRRGYRYEQEWAFNWGYTKAVNLIAGAIQNIFGIDNLDPHWLIVTAIALSNICHIASTFIIYRLTMLVVRGPFLAAKSFALLTSALHILSPAGLFLSAPYSESLFSLLSMTGYYCYGISFHRRSNTFLLASGFFLALSSMVRGNGILGGILFFFDFIHSITSLSKGLTATLFWRIITLGLSGVIVGVGMAIPQAIAWKQFCYGDVNKASWCVHHVPSIYTWVQGHYWNVGFLRYWTVSNIPLFALAVPTLVVLLLSGKWSLTRWLQSTKPTIAPKEHSEILGLNEALVGRLALPQIVLTVMAITSYHVQIINRISSGYIVWYWFIAWIVMDQQKPERLQKTKLWILWMLPYGLVQAVLFASFLPPA